MTHVLAKVIHTLYKIPWKLLNRIIISLFPVEKKDLLPAYSSVPNLKDL